MATKKQRNLPGFNVKDPSIIDNLRYNDQAGGDKNISIGAKLLPIPDGAGGYTTDASTAAKPLPKFGCNLAIFNKSTTTDYSITVGDSTVAAQAIGAIQAGTQFVGIACPFGVWTYVSCGYYDNYVITNNNNLVVYMMDDASGVVTESN